MKLSTKEVLTWWGKFQITAGLSGLYITGINFLLLTITAYPVITEDYLHPRGILLSFIQFEVIVIVGIVLLLYGVWRIARPGYYRATNQQTWNNENPMKVELDKQAREIAELKKMLMELSNK